MSFYQSLSYPKDADERRHDRQPVALPARVRELGRPGSGGHVRDLSLGGCRLAGIDLPKEAEVWVAIGGAPPRRARIVWMKAGETGCSFYTPMTRAELRNVILGRG
jgi:hypothetical protein